MIDAPFNREITQLLTIISYNEYNNKFFFENIVLSIITSKSSYLILQLSILKNYL